MDFIEVKISKECYINYFKILAEVIDRTERFLEIITDNCYDNVYIDSLYNDFLDFSMKIYFENCLETGRDRYGYDGDEDRFCSLIMDTFNCYNTSKDDGAIEVLWNVMSGKEVLQ